MGVAVPLSDTSPEPVIVFWDSNTSTLRAGGTHHLGGEMRQEAAGNNGLEVATVVRLRGDNGAWDCVAAHPQRRRSSSVTSSKALLTPSGTRVPSPATWRFSVPLSPGRLPLNLRTNPDKIFGGVQEDLRKGSSEGFSRGTSAGLFRRLAIRMKEVCLK